MTTSSSIENAALGAGITTGLMGVIAQNATVISLGMTALFGLTYAACAVWNAHSNHRRNKVSEKSLLESIINSMIKDGEPAELISKVEERKDKL